jgi:uncharacterized protein (DUF885 family)
MNAKLIITLLSSLFITWGLSVPALSCPPDPPPDCTAEAAAAEAADAAADAAYNALVAALANYSDALAAEQIAASNLSVADTWYLAASTAYYIAISMVPPDPLAITAALVWLIAAEHGLEVAEWQMNIAAANTLAALDAYITAANDYTEAEQAAVDALQALIDCLLGS